MSGGRFIRAGLCAAAVLAVMGAGLSPVATAATTSSTGAVATAARVTDRGLLGTVSSTRWFSPNGDGVQDKVRVGMALERRASVTVTVRRAGRRAVVRRVSLGSRKAGARVWSWDGRNDRGRVVRDGGYRVTVVAERGRARVERDATRVALRTTYTPPTGAAAPSVELSRDTIHPTTPDFTDLLQISALQRLAERAPLGGGRSWSTAPEMQVRDADGRVVQAWPEDATLPGRGRAWTATTPSGAPLPAGAYQLVVHFRDNYGNTGLVRHPIAVSAAPLVAQHTWSTEVAAADVLTSPPVWYSGCSRDCVPTCSPSPSLRTAGALTLRSPLALRTSGRDCVMSVGMFEAQAPFTLGPLDRLTLTTNASEHPSGGTGQAYVGLSSAVDQAGVRTTPGTSRTTVGPVFYGDWDPDASTDRLRWYTDGSALGDTEHDLETFEVHVVRYAPAS